MGHVYKELNKRRIDIGPYYFPQRLILELCENIHLHYRNMRLEFSNTEFCEMYRCFKEGFKEFQKYTLDNSEVKTIKLSEIDPFDPGHIQEGNYFNCGKKLQQEHVEGIELVKKAIKEGKKIRPIAVVWDKNINKYKRMDGFKRYWAYKELQKDSIECYILKEYIPGIQEDMPERMD